MDLAFDSRKEAKVDKIELVTLLDCADRFGAMDGVRAPCVTITFEERRQLRDNQALKHSRRVGASYLPDGDIVAFDDEEQRRTERAKGLHEIDTLTPFGWNDGEGGGPIRGGRLRECGERRRPRLHHRVENIGEGVVPHYGLPAIARCLNCGRDGVDCGHGWSPRRFAAAVDGTAVGGNRSTS